MANQITKERQIEIIHHLAEGNSLRATSRLLGVHRNTCMRTLVEFGPACNHFMDLSFANLNLSHVQIDEIWTFVKKKQGQLTDEEKKSDSTIGDVYLFIGLDEDTKLIPAYSLGKRTSENAEDIAQQLRRRILRRPGVSDQLRVSTDGFAGYPAAVRNAFNGTARHGVLIKQYANPESGRYAPPKLTRTERENVSGVSDLATICTSHVERTNLTIRTFMRRFTRLALGFSKKIENLEAAVQLHLCYYNFCWQPREKGKSGKLRPTPAMMAGLTDHVWTISELYENVAGLEQDRLAFERYAKLRKKLFGDD